MGIAENLKRLREEMPEGVELVAVSKFQPIEKLSEAYAAGQRLFGESRVQELLEKEEILPDDIRWHFIGHLQTNKVKQLIGKTALIESVDSQRLLELIDRESEKSGIVTDVLLQIHVAREETKFGFYPDELIELLETGIFSSLKRVKVRGLMGMATNTDDEKIVREDFHQLNDLFEMIRGKYHEIFPDFDILSMGMSGDWRLAVEEGSNLVRIGSAIFGERK